MVVARSILIIGLFGAAGALGASCFVGGFVTVEGSGGAGGIDPTGGGGGRGGAAGAPGCSHATWPPPPVSADPGANTEDFVVAVRTIDFGEAADGSENLVGYDLDNRCTCQGEGPSCNEPAWATADHCDGPAGRDNAAAQIFAAFSPFTVELGSEFNSQQAESGQWSLLIRIRDYNGMANDDQVTLTIYPSPGMDKDHCLGPDPAPAWDGTDAWPISAQALNGWGGASSGGGGASSGVGGCGGASPWNIEDARYNDANAYVNDWVVVANLPQAGMVLASSGRVSPLLITAGFVTARIERGSTSGMWQLREGMFTGRWKLTDFLAMLGTIEQAGTTLCTDHPVYSLIKSELCRYPDVASALTGPTTPCDALSFAMGLSADAARIGRVWTTTHQATTCTPETDPANDDCEP